VVAGWAGGFSLQRNFLVLPHSWFIKWVAAGVHGHALAPAAVGRIRGQFGAAVHLLSGCEPLEPELDLVFRKRQPAESKVSAA